MTCDILFIGNVARAYLPPRQTITNDQNAMAAGWGVVNVNGERATRLMKLAVTTINPRFVYWYYTLQRREERERLDLADRLDVICTHTNLNAGFGQGKVRRQNAAINYHKLLELLRSPIQDSFKYFTSIFSIIC